MHDPFENAINQIIRAAKVAKEDSEVLELMSHPQREVHVAIPVKMDDGSLRIFEGYRVQHNDWRGPAVL